MHLEKAIKYLDKLARKADAKYYEKAMKEIKKAGINGPVEIEKMAKTAKRIERIEQIEKMPEKTMANVINIKQIAKDALKPEPANTIKDKEHPEPEKTIANVVIKQLQVKEDPILQQKTEITKKIQSLDGFTNKEIIQWTVDKGISKETAIETMKELTDKGIIYPGGYDKKTKTISFLHARELSRQNQVIEKAITNIYNNTSKKSFSINDIKREIEKMKESISDRTIAKYLNNSKDLQKNEKGKYEFKEDSARAVQDKEIIKIYLDKFKDKEYFTAKELHKGNKQSPQYE